MTTCFEPIDPISDEHGWTRVRESLTSSVLIRVHPWLKKSSWSATISLLILLVSGMGATVFGAEPSFSQPKSEWKRLFNGKDLSDWDKYLATSNGEIVPNHDPKNVFTVMNLQGETVIHVSGETYGAITTRDEFENFHARLEFKWGDKRWPPRATVGRDSGLLNCCVGNPNPGTGWMTSIENNIMERGSHPARARVGFSN